MFFLFCAFRSGSDRFYLKKAQGISASGKDVLYYFKPEHILSLFLFYLNFYLRKVLNLFISLLPFAVVCAALFFYVTSEGASLAVSVVVLLTVAVLLVSGIICFFRLNSCLFLARYLFVSGGYFSYRQLFSFSSALMNGKRGIVLRKKLSFAGWFFSCFFVFPLSFVRSYYNLSMAELAFQFLND